MKPVLLIGPKESGKSHIAHCIAQPFAEKARMYITGDEAKTLESYRRKDFPMPRVVIVDEVYRESELQIVKARLEGLAKGQRISPFFIFCLRSDDVIPSAEFQKIYCSYHLIHRRDN